MLLAPIVWGIGLITAGLAASGCTSASKTKETPETKEAPETKEGLEIKAPTKADAPTPELPAPMWARVTPLKDKEVPPETTEEKNMREKLERGVVSAEKREYLTVAIRHLRVGTLVYVDSGYTCKPSEDCGNASTIFKAYLIRNYSEEFKVRCHENFGKSKAAAGEPSALKGIQCVIGKKEPPSSDW